MADRNGRSRTWAFILYPESAPENWRELLEDLVIPTAISPLHDKDVWTDACKNQKHKAGDRKKPHYHVVFYFTNKKSPKQVLDAVEPLGVHYVEAVGETIAYNRYLCHLDQPDKAQYSPDEIVRLNGAECSLIKAMGADEQEAVLLEIMAFIRNNGITEYAGLVDWCLDNNLDWFRVTKKQTIFLRGYLSSARGRRSSRSS